MVDPGLNAELRPKSIILTFMESADHRLFSRASSKERRFTTVFEDKVLQLDIAMDNPIFVTMRNGLNHHFEDLLSKRLVQGVLRFEKYVPQIIHHLIHDKVNLLTVLMNVVEAHDPFMIKLVHN